MATIHDRAEREIDEIIAIAARKRGETVAQYVRSLPRGERERQIALAETSIRKRETAERAVRRVVRRGAPSSSEGVERAATLALAAGCLTAGMERVRLLTEHMQRTCPEGFRETPECARFDELRRVSADALVALARLVTSTSTKPLSVTGITELHDRAAAADVAIMGMFADRAPKTSPEWDARWRWATASLGWLRDLIVTTIDKSAAAWWRVFRWFVEDQSHATRKADLAGSEKWRARFPDLKERMLRSTRAAQDALEQCESELRILSAAGIEVRRTDGARAPLDGENAAIPEGSFDWVRRAIGRIARIRTYWAVHTIVVATSLGVAGGKYLADWPFGQLQAALLSMGDALADAYAASLGRPFPALVVASAHALYFLATFQRALAERAALRANATYLSGLTERERERAEARILAGDLKEYERDVTSFPSRAIGLAGALLTRTLVFLLAVPNLKIISESLLVTTPRSEAVPWITRYAEVTGRFVAREGDVLLRTFGLDDVADAWTGGLDRPGSVSTYTINDTSLFSQSPVVAVAINAEGAHVPVFSDLEAASAVARGWRLLDPAEWNVEVGASNFLANPGGGDVPADRALVIAEAVRSTYRTLEASEILRLRLGRRYALGDDAPSLVRWLDRNAALAASAADVPALIGGGDDVGKAVLRLEQSVADDLAAMLLVRVPDAVRPASFAQRFLGRLRDPRASVTYESIMLVDRLVVDAARRVPILSRVLGPLRGPAVVVATTQRYGVVEAMRSLGAAVVAYVLEEPLDAALSIAALSTPAVLSRVLVARPVLSFAVTRTWTVLVQLLGMYNLPSKVLMRVSVDPFVDDQTPRQALDALARALAGLPKTSDAGTVSGFVEQNPEFREYARTLDLLMAERTAFRPNTDPGEFLAFVARERAPAVYAIDELLQAGDPLAAEYLESLALEDFDVSDMPALVKDTAACSIGAAAAVKSGPRARRQVRRVARRTVRRSDVLDDDDDDDDDDVVG